MSGPSTSTSQVLVTLFHTIAIASTTFRLFYRLRTRRFWWDDAWAGLSLICDISLFVPVWACNFATESVETRARVYWFSLVAFNCDLWTSRMSLVFAIIRITPPILKMRAIACGTAVIIACIWLGLLSQAIYNCGHDTSWYSDSVCTFKHSVVIAQLCMDLVADVLLIAIPVRLLWRTKVPKNHRRLLFMLFSASIFTTIASIARATVILDEAVTGLSEGIATNAQAAISLIVCNLLVVGTCVYRLLGGQEDIESSVDYSGLVFQGFGRAADPEPEVGLTVV